METGEILRAAFARRDGLDLQTDAVRLFDGVGDGLDRLVVERLGEAIRVTGAPTEAPLLDAVRAALPPETPLFWRFGNDTLGGPDEGRRMVAEGDLRFQVELLPNRNTGLFLDARPARRWVRANSDGRRVLNLFSFTGSLGVAAARGGARSTVNVEPVPRAQARAAENYAANGLTPDGRTFWRADALEALKRARSGGAQFDAVILDPPPVPTGGDRGRGGRVDVRADLVRLLRAAREVLAPEGWLLLLCASRIVDPDAAAAEAGLGATLWSGTSDGDFVALPESPTLRLRAFRR